MARVLQFHPASLPGYRVPGYPNVHHDDERLAKEAQLRGVSPEAYAEALLAYRWPDEKPAFTLAPAGKKDEALVKAAEQAAPPTPPEGPAPTADGAPEEPAPRAKG